jgi:hypothetical protein
LQWLAFIILLPWSLHPRTGSVRLFTALDLWRFFQLLRALADSFLLPARIRSCAVYSFPFWREQVLLDWISASARFRGYAYWHDVMSPTELQVNVEQGGAVYIIFIPCCFEQSASICEM